MKVLKKNVLNALMAVVMLFSFIFSGWSGVITAINVKAETTVVNLTYKSMQFQNNTENAGTYWTSLCFYPSVGEGVSTGNPTGEIAADFSDLLDKTTYTGSENTVLYTPACHWGWTMDFKSSTFSFIYFRTVNMPETGDTLQLKSGAWFVTGGAIDDKYVLSEDINLKFNGTQWETYTPVVDTTALEAEFTNNGQFTLSQYSGQTYTFANGADFGVPAGYKGAVVRVLSGGAGYVDLDFSASKIPAASVESVIARVYSPDYTAADELRINNTASTLGGAGAHDMSTWCDVALPLELITGADGNLGAFTFGIRDKGTISDYFYIDSITVNMVQVVESTKVTFSHINSSWNDNTAILNNGNHYTVLHITGLQTSGYLTQGDDWSSMIANSTINGGASYFNFSPASYIAGPNVASDFIILYTATAPTAGDEFIVKAGATFKVGGEDKNVYELTNDICLKYNGTAWEVFTPTVEPEQPDVPVVPDTVEATFTSINTAWNSYYYENTYCSLLYFDGGIGSGALDGNYSDLLSKMTINGVAVDTSNVSFICPLWIGTNGGIILRFVTNPAAGSVMTLPAGATFSIGGEDTNVYEISEDVNLIFNGTKWEVYVPGAEIEYTTVDLSFGELGLNGAANNDAAIAGGKYVTCVRFTSGVLSGSADLGRANYDYSNLIENTTYSGSGEFGFMPAVTAGWPAGYKNDAVFNFFYFYTTSQPVSGDKIVMKAGAYFTMSGVLADNAGNCDDKYVLSQDIILTFNGTVWATAVSTSYYVFESTNPDVLHTYSTFQNADGSFTYTLPEYTAEGKVLLGYVMNSGTGEDLVQTFIPFGEYTTAETGLIFIALWGGFKTIDGASIRISQSNTSGIRWTTTIDEEGMGNIAYWATSFVFGTELTTNDDRFTDKFDIELSNWVEEERSYTGVLTDITSDYYTTTFTGKGYVDITYSNGVTKRIYAIAKDTTRSIKQVAERALADTTTNYSPVVIAILNKIAGVN